MKRVLRLLIVEDDERVIETYQSSIKAFNKTEPDIEITAEFENAKDNAITILKNPDKNFDGAIVDLNLKGLGVNDASGNEVIKEITENLQFPVFVISGTPHSVDKDFTESDFLKIRQRDEADFDYLGEFVKIFNTGITQILNRKGTIEKKINDIFWKHLSSSLSLWKNDDKNSPENKQKSLLRYVLSHLNEHLELTEESDFEDYLPAEIYITPPIKNKVFTGDLVVDKELGDYYVVLTPSCDLAQSKAKDLLLASVETFDKENLLSNTIASAKKGDLDSETNLKNIIKNSYSPKYHFLPGYLDIKMGIINFQKLCTVRVKDFDKKYEVKAAINGNFTKDIVARFSYYYARQGSPDFNVQDIYNSIVNPN